MSLAVIFWLVARRTITVMLVAYFTTKITPQLHLPHPVLTLI